MTDKTEKWKFLHDSLNGPELIRASLKRPKICRKFLPRRMGETSKKKRCAKLVSLQRKLDTVVAARMVFSSTKGTFWNLMSPNELLHFIYIFIHPSSFAYLRLSHSGNKSRRKTYTSRSPAPPGGSRGVPRSEGIHNPTSMLWVCPGASSQLDVPGKSPKGSHQGTS